MGILDRLMGRVGVAEGVVVATPSSSVAVTSVPYLDTRSAVSLSPVWRCVNLIADTISDMIWREWRGDEILPTSRLVRRPYALMTRREWTQRVVRTEALFNTVHLLHVGGTDAAGSPWSLMPLPPAVVQPGMADPWGLLPPAEYQVAGQRVDAQYVTVIRRAPFPGISDQVSGLLELARREFTAYLAADVAMSRYWVAGGPTTAVLSSDQELTSDDADAIAQRWADRRSMGADFPVVLGKGASAEPWGADPTSESAVEARREINADVARYFGVPTRIVNAPAGDSETYANVESDAIDLLRYTLRGYIGPIEDAISELLPGDYIEGRRMEMDPSRFLQGDLPSRATAYVALTSGDRPILDVDEARVRGFGLPPRQPADELAPEPAAGSAPTAVVSVTPAIAPAVT